VAASASRNSTTAGALVRRGSTVAVDLAPLRILEDPVLRGSRAARDGQRGEAGAGRLLSLPVGCERLS
jgi:hypothetical protein